MSHNRSGHPFKGNPEWGSKGRKHNDRDCGRNNDARRQAIREQLS